MKTIALSAGHGAGDSGTTYKELREDNLTKIITKRACDMIRKHGVLCLEVPDELTLKQTIDWINARAIDICVETHINSGGGSGVEGWNYAGGPNESDKLSKYLVDALNAETGLTNRGIKDESQNRHGRLGFVHDTRPVAALVECGFIDGDYLFLKVDDNLNKLAKGVARGCLSYLGYAWKPELINPQPVAPKIEMVAKSLLDQEKEKNKSLEERILQLEKYKSAVLQTKKLFESL